MPVLKSAATAATTAAQPPPPKLVGGPGTAHTRVSGAGPGKAKTQCGAIVLDVPALAGAPACTACANPPKFIPTMVTRPHINPTK